MAHLKALVVDDSRVMRSMVMQNLKKANLADFEFVEAEDGQDALNKYAPEICIAFVDWNMPNMNGVEFVREVRKREGDGEDDLHMPIVMVTSEKTMSKIEEALDQAGADAFISKPFTAEELAVKLKKVVAKSEQVQIQKLRRQREESAAPPPAQSGFFSKMFG
jgi:two-component system chemotaxis response regulator CheY